MLKIIAKIETSMKTQRIDPDAVGTPIIVLRY